MESECTAFVLQLCIMIVDIIYYCDTKVSFQLYVRSGSFNESFQVSWTCDCDLLKVSNWTLTFDNETRIQQINVRGLKPGQAVLRVWNATDNTLDISEAFARISIIRHKYLDILSEICGWVYFVAWTINFFPQMWTNYKRKSVQGLSLDFICLNILGFFAYSVFNCCIYFIPQVKAEYFRLNPYGVLPIQVNDIAFALLALAGSSAVGIQAIIYDRGSQTVSKASIFFLMLSLVFSSVTLILTGVKVITWLSYLYYFSYIKLAITLIKYTPQVYLNYQRKSTEGYNILTVNLDVVGGALSLLQMFIIVCNYGDWSSMAGNPTKLFLGLVSLFFDFTFIYQHYFAYRRRRLNSEFTEALINESEQDQEVY